MKNSHLSEKFTRSKKIEFTLKFKIHTFKKDTIHTYKKKFTPSKNEKSIERLVVFTEQINWESESCTNWTNQFTPQNSHPKNSHPQVFTSLRIHIRCRIHTLLQEFTTPKIHTFSQYTSFQNPHLFAQFTSFFKIHTPFQHLEFTTFAEFTPFTLNLNYTIHTL